MEEPLTYSRDFNRGFNRANIIKHRKGFLTGLFLTLLPISIYAQAYKNIASVRWGLSSEMMMDFKLDYHYMFNKYIGVGRLYDKVELQGAVEP